MANIERISGREDWGGGGRNEGKTDTGWVMGSIYRQRSYGFGKSGSGF